MATERSRALLAAATAVLVALPTAASAQSFTPGDDPCLGDPPPAEYVDREKIIDIHLPAVDCTTDNGIFEGDLTTGPGREFNPAQPLTRAQMASIIARSLEYAGYQLPAAPPDAFQDDTTNVHQLNINKLAAVGIVTGVSDTRFNPQAPVKRDQMASFMVRTAEVAFGTEFEPTVPNPFSDLSDRNVHRDNIIVASNQLGLAVGRADSTFDAGALTRRDHAATFISRLVDIILIDAEQPATDPASGPTTDISDADRDLSGTPSVP